MNGDSDDDDDDDSYQHSKYYTHTIEAIKTKTGLDIGYKVVWPKRHFSVPRPQQEPIHTANDHEHSMSPTKNRLLNDGDEYDDSVRQLSSTKNDPNHSNIDQASSGDNDKQDDQNDDNDEDEDEFVALELSTQLPSDCIAPMFHGTQWAGTTIWRSAVVALQYLLYYQKLDMDHSITNNNDDDRIDTIDTAVTVSNRAGTADTIGVQLDSNTTLLELGCGLGVPGMVLHAMTGCRTILTDKDDLLLQLQRNIQINFTTTASSPTETDSSHNTQSPDQHTTKTGKIEALALDWSIEGVHKLLKHGTNSSFPSINVVLACDCIYEPLYGDSWRHLLRVQNELLRLYPQAYVLTACHRRPSDGIDSYLVEANQQPSISRTEQLRIPFAHSSVVELYRLHGVS